MAQRPIRLSELAKRLGCPSPVVPGGEDPLVVGITTVEAATPAHLTFVISPKFLEAALKSPAAAVLLPAGTPGAEARPCLQIKDMMAGMLAALRIFHPDRVCEPGVHPTAVVDPAASLGEGVSVQPSAVIEAGATVGERTVIGAGAFVGREATIGADCVLGPRAIVMDECILGDRVLLQPGAVIGADGFKYQWDGSAHVKIPQIGIVVIEDDVEIGAGACIDRASFTETRIGRGTKIDNLVQIGHNCTVGPNCIVVAQVGLAGSVKVGEGALLAGQVGSADNISIGAGAQIGAQTGLHRDVPPGAKMFGTPAVPAAEGMRNAAALNRLPAALRELRQLVERVEALEKKQG